MDDTMGTPARQGHVQRVEHQFGTKMIGHRPSHDAPAEHIEHDGQIQKPLPGRHVGDIGHPETIRHIGVKLALDAVRRGTTTPIHCGGARAPASAHPGQARLTHQARHSLTAHSASPGRQLGVDSRHPVGASGRLVNTAHPGVQLLVAPGARRHRPTSPSVEPAGGDTIEHPTHRRHPMHGLVRSHELEDLPDIVPVSRANQTAAFFRISRSSRSRRFSRRNRRSSSRSSVLKPSSLRPSSRSHCPTQLRIV